jgi:hypothetical protein
LRFFLCRKKEKLRCWVRHKFIEQVKQEIQMYLIGKAWVYRKDSKELV